jgi:hypothetical protein
MDEEMILPNESSCFYPDNLLQELICKEVVSKILEDNKIPGDRPILTDFICTKAKRVFAILLSCEQASLIMQFSKCGFTDDMLPVGLGIHSGSSDAMESFSMRSKDDEIVKNMFDDPVWSYRKRREFYKDRQWPFLSPIFTEEVFRYKFHEECHMPFMEKKAEIRKDSFFSYVERRRIHRAHLRISLSIVRR